MQAYVQRDRLTQVKTLRASYSEGDRITLQPNGWV